MHRILLIATGTADKMPGKYIKILRKIYAAKLPDEKPRSATEDRHIPLFFLDYIDCYHVPAQQTIVYELSTL